MEQPGSDEIQATVVDLLSQIIEMEPASIAAEARLSEDLGVDSLSMLELVIGIEEQCGVRIADRDVAGLVTVDDVVRLVAAAL